MVVLRPAHAGEAGQLSELAMRSKAHWGYDEAFLNACRAELTFSASYLAAARAVVAESDGQVVGFCTVDGTPPEGDLGNLWVDPDAIGTGVGRLLWRHALGIARAEGFTALRIEADPHAEGFYLAMGAVRIGQSRSGSIAGRTLPVLRFPLGP